MVAKQEEYTPPQVDGQFTTYDLGATTALICSGYALMSIDWENPNKALFVFRRESGIEETLDEYWADQLEVKARRYFDSLKAVKSRLYSNK